MNNPPQILVVDDERAHRALLERRLKASGYVVLQAGDGIEAIAAARQQPPDVMLLDVTMPKLDGLEVCRRLKDDDALPFIPIILVTGNSDTPDIVAGLDAGADEYLTKPIDPAALVARVRSALRLKSLYDQVAVQKSDLAKWNRTLEQRVAEQLAAIERIAPLKRFLAPQIVDLITAADGEAMLASHRRDVTVVFCDMRGFTGFAEITEPEEVMGILAEYHASLGALIHEFEGTLERFLGDGLLVLFNDPVRCPDPSLRAVRMAVAMRDRMAELGAKWRNHGHVLGFGIGIAHGYATLGRIGFEGRTDYTVIGAVPNLAARLCGHAGDGQILVDSKVRTAVFGHAEIEPVGDLTLRGFHRPIPVFNIVGLQPAAPELATPAVGAEQPQDASSWAAPSANS